MGNELKNSNMELNEIWEKKIKALGADFVRFVDISEFSKDVTEGCSCAVLFGKSLSKEYISAVKNDEPPKHKEVFNTENKMDSLSVKLAQQLEAEGYKGIAKLKTGIMPHKTVALRAGLGFIGKNNLLITPEYGCALMMGKVLTDAPFAAKRTAPEEPQCGSCNVCEKVCPNKALLGKTWSITTTRDEIITRKLCVLCLKCMACCPYTAEYLK